MFLCFLKVDRGVFFLATHYTETFLHFVSQHFFVSFFSSNCSIFFGKQVAVHRWRWLVVGDFSFFRNFLFLKGEGYFLKEICIYRVSVSKKCDIYGSSLFLLGRGPKLNEQIGLFLLTKKGEG